VRIDYDAPPSCPDQSAFSWQVSARTTRARLVEASESARTFRIVISLVDSTHLGRLTIVEVDGRQSVRELQAPSCSELVDALALVTALAIDPRADTRPLETLPQTPVSTTPPGSMPLRRTPSSPPHKESAHRQPPASAGRAAAARTAPLRWTLGATITALSAVAPTPLIVLGPFGEATWDDHSLLAPTARVQVGISPTSSIDAAGARAHFALRPLGLLETCPLRLSFASWASARPICAAFHAGLVRASSSGTVEPRSETRQWLALGLSARLFEAAVGALRLDLGAGVVFPLARDRYLIEPKVIHKVPVAGFDGSAAIGLRLP
jgi:hypothetical protein